MAGEGEEGGGGGERRLIDLRGFALGKKELRGEKPAPSTPKKPHPCFHVQILALVSFTARDVWDF